MKKKKSKYSLDRVSINIHLMIFNKLLVLNYAEKVQLIHISYNVNAVLKPFFPKQPKVRFRVSSKEGNFFDLK